MAAPCIRKSSAPHRRCAVRRRLRRRASSPNGSPQGLVRGRTSPNSGQGSSMTGRWGVLVWGGA